MLMVTEVGLLVPGLIFNIQSAADPDLSKEEWGPAVKANDPLDDQYEYRKNILKE